jgi:hypothetical protein
MAAAQVEFWPLSRHREQIMTPFAFFGITLAVVLCASSGCSKSSGSGAGGGGSAWMQNGASACGKYLSHDLVAAILSNPTGTSKTLSSQACSFTSADSGGSISITLTNAGPAAFEAYQKYLVDPVPLPGVGDKASQSLIGIDAVKGADRSCSIDAGGAPGSLKLHGAQLGQELGAICNQLFALP